MRRETPGQIEMSLTQSEAAPVATVEDVEKIVGILACSIQLTAAEICRELGWVINENNKRKVRAIARAARPGIVSFPNSNGYKLFRNCTVEEIRSCVNHWRSVEKDAAQTWKLFQDAMYVNFGANA